MEQSGSKKPSTFHTTKADGWERTESVIHRFYLSHTKQLFTVRGRVGTVCDTVRDRAIQSNNIKFENRWRNSWQTFTLVNTVGQILCGPVKLQYFIAVTKCAITCAPFLYVCLCVARQRQQRSEPSRSFLQQDLFKHWISAAKTTQWNFQKQHCC